MSRTFHCFFWTKFPFFWKKHNFHFWTKFPFFWKKHNFHFWTKFQFLNKKFFNTNSDEFQFLNKNKIFENNPICQILFDKIPFLGTIIHPNFVMTAAHCCRSHKMSNYEFWSNKYFRSDAPRQYIPTVRIKHPKFNSYTIENDFCLLFTENEIQYDAFVTPACLPPPSAEFKIFV